MSIIKLNNKKYYDYSHIPYGYSIEYIGKSNEYFTNGEFYARCAMMPDNIHNVLIIFNDLGIMHTYWGVDMDSWSLDFFMDDEADVSKFINSCTGK